MRSVQRIAIEEKWQKEVAQIIELLKSSAKKDKAANSTSPNVLEVMSRLRKATSLAKVGCSSSCCLYSTHATLLCSIKSGLRNIELHIKHSFEEFSGSDRSVCMVSRNGQAIADTNPIGFRARGRQRRKLLGM